MPWFASGCDEFIVQARSGFALDDAAAECRVQGRASVRRAPQSGMAAGPNRRAIHRGDANVASREQHAVAPRFLVKIHRCAAKALDPAHDADDVVETRRCGVFDGRAFHDERDAIASRSAFADRFRTRAAIRCAPARKTSGSSRRRRCRLRRRPRNTPESATRKSADRQPAQLPARGVLRSIDIFIGAFYRKPRKHREIRQYYPR